MVKFEPIDTLSNAEETVDLDNCSAFTDSTDEDTVSALTEPHYGNDNDIISYDTKEEEHDSNGCTAKSTSDLFTETIKDASDVLGKFVSSLNAPSFNMNARLSSAAIMVKQTVNSAGSSIKNSVDVKVAEREQSKREKVRQQELYEEIQREKGRMQYMADVRHECADVANLWRE